jgi:hypothetical protein
LQLMRNSITRIIPIKHKWSRCKVCLFWGVIYDTFPHKEIELLIKNKNTVVRRAENAELGIRNLE